MPRIFGVKEMFARNSLLAQSRDALYRLLIPVIVGLSLGSPILLFLWAPSSFRPATLVLPVAVIVIAAIPCAGALSHTRTLLAEGRTFLVALGTFVGAGVNLALNVVLVPRFGVLGSACATLIGYSSMHVIFGRWAAAAVVLPRPRSRLIVELSLAEAVACAAAAVPVALPFLLLRSCGTLICVAIFLVVLTTLALPVTKRDGNPLLSWLRARLHPLLMTVEHAGEPVDHRGQPGGDLGELDQRPPAAELLGVMHDRLEAQDAFAFGVPPSASTVRSGP
jgi:O-antigen/teichoic acid export membrane protein